ncbi:MAG: GNAT family N-acetyltransferase [Microscillaceae bacterium]|jgi:predicted GNAT superfamily acetyltransferase|nr:GNAT family N-acetyltransferase [Microscillaceae bacterium]
MKIEIREGTIADILTIYPQIPEFKNPHEADEYARRLDKAPKSLILIAWHQDQALAFKVGYERDNDGSFYSWMGGVAQPYRRYGIAKQLADYQEDWAKKQGYTRIRFKTRNSHLPMLLFALQNGFQIIGLEPYYTVEENRILLEKKL